MREILILLASLSLVLGLRSSKSRLAKKLAAFLFILSMSILGYIVFSHICGAFFMGGIWFLFPCITIYTKRAKALYSLRLNEISILPSEKETFFPNTLNYQLQLDLLEFEPLNNKSWQWLDSHQHHRFYWNPEVNTVASICLCELENIVFTYIVFHSEFSDETVIRTTNYPFVSPLKHQPKSVHKHVACEEVSLENILAAHKRLVNRASKKTHKISIPNPETVHKNWAEFLEKKIQYNLDIGLIKPVGKQFKFTKKGLFYLWVQSVIDLIRLC